MRQYNRPLMHEFQTNCTVNSVKSESRICRTTSKMVESSLARLMQFAWSRGGTMELTKQYFPHLGTGSRKKKKSKSSNLKVLRGREVLAIPEEETGKQILNYGGRI